MHYQSVLRVRPVGLYTVSGDSVYTCCVFMIKALSD